MKRKLLTAMLAILCFACTQEEIVHCKDDSGHRSLIKNGEEFFCPFTFRVKNAEKEWENVEKPTIITKDADNYYPLSLRNSWDSYNIFMLVPSKYFTEEQYIVSLRTYDIEFKPYGESKEILFYKIKEENDMVEYRSYKDGETYKDGIGQFIFFAQREMPPYDWYQVINVGDDGKGFILKGEIVE